MKHPLIFVLLACLLLSACTAAPAQSPAGDQVTDVQTSASSGVLQPGVESPWQVVFQKSTEQTLRVAAFYSRDYGITGGPSEAGIAHYTLDGAGQWTPATSSADCLFGLDIVDTQVAWECGLGPVRVSTDGAQTWQPAADYGNYCRQLSFLDAQNGWVASAKTLAATTDGGKTWQPISLPQKDMDIAAMSLHAAQTGYVLGTDGVVYATQDGGASWLAHPLPLESGGSKLSAPETASAAVRFTDTDHGLVVIHLTADDKSQLLILRTSDSGQSWQPELSMNAPLLISVYLSHDGSTLTVTDKLNSQITVLQYTD